MCDMAKKSGRTPVWKPSETRPSEPFIRERDYQHLHGTRPLQNKIPPPDTQGESGAAQAAPADCPQSPPENLQQLDQAIPRSPSLEAGALGTGEAGDADR